LNLGSDGEPGACDPQCGWNGQVICLGVVAGDKTALRGWRSGVTDWIPQLAPTAFGLVHGSVAFYPWAGYALGTLRFAVPGSDAEPFSLEEFYFIF